jgi:transposase
MASMRKQFSAAFKAQVVHELLKEEKSIAQLAAEYGVHPTQLGKWKALALHGLPSLFEERAEVGALKTAHEAQLTALYAEIGRLTTQVAWLKKKVGLPPG